jgi:hypothetical protein
MSNSLSRAVIGPAEQLFRAVIKNALASADPPKPIVPHEPRYERVLPPLLGEMGGEIRLHIARVEPWLRNGWKVMSRHAAFYPKGTAIYDPEFFAAADAILNSYGVVGSRGGFIVTPADAYPPQLQAQFNGATGQILLTLEDASKATRQALAEIELRKLFLAWFCTDDRRINDYDHTVLSFASTGWGTWEYRSTAALRPSFKPPAFEEPPEPVPPHVGVQMRYLTHVKPQPRNSDPDWMLATAKAIAEHLGVELMVYGHPKGCVIPEGYKTSWDPARPEGQKERELGYLKSCRLMLAPDSGWADLMAWLQVPTLLEMAYAPGDFECLRDNFLPRLDVVDRNRPIGEQVDALLNAPGPVLFSAKSSYFVDKESYPWEP